MMVEVKDEIKCIFFSEFHPTAGPRIGYQVPKDYISKEQFDSIHVYIITKPELQSRIITINAFGWKIVGCPVCIENQSYERNAYIFNLCFVFDASTNTQPHEVVVKKLAGYLTTLEVESGYLTQENAKECVPMLLAELLEELNQCGACVIPINASTTIHLKVIPPHIDPRPVLGHEVPIIINSSHTVTSDLATKQLLPYMDGCKHVARIAAEADVDVNIVKACVQNLVYHGALKLISIFQYSNVYMTTPQITKLTEDKDLQEDCLKYVAKSGKMPGFRDVLQLYCGLTAGMTVRDLCSRYNPHSLGVDERKLIQFGLMHGVIRRLQKYPIKLPNEPGSSRLRHLYRWFNGRHGYDEICAKLGLSYHELDEKVENDPSIVVCWK